MNIELFREYCIAKKGVEESFPFGEDTLVFKVGGKMFCLIGLVEADRCNLKCNPERALDLRQLYSSIIPGYHMNKNHWNTIYFNQDANDQLILELVDHSYELVRESLPKKMKETLL